MRPMVPHRHALNLTHRRSIKVGEALVARLKADEDAVEAYFSQFLRPEKLGRYVEQLGDVRELMSSNE